MHSDSEVRTFCGSCRCSAARAAWRAPTILTTVLAKLDAAAKDFHTTTANFEFDTIQTDPVPDTDVMTGMAYYERKGNSFQMAAHITSTTTSPTAKTYIFSGGVLRSLRHRQGKRRQDLSTRPASTRAI